MPKPCKVPPSQASPAPSTSHSQTQRLEKGKAVIHDPSPPEPEKVWIPKRYQTPPPSSGRGESSQASTSSPTTSTEEVPTPSTSIAPSISESVPPPLEPLIPIRSWESTLPPLRLDVSNVMPTPYVQPQPQQESTWHRWLQSAYTSMREVKV